MAARPAHPIARNARTHSADQVAQIAASVAEFGFNNPVLVDPEGGIIAGHGRVLAARRLGFSQVPVIVLAHLNQTQKRAFALADNKLTLRRAVHMDGMSIRQAARDFGLSGAPAYGIPVAV